MTVDNLQDLYLEQLRDLYNAESQLAEALPEMKEMASDEELESAFQEHHQQTQEQKERLEQLFDNLGEDPTGEKCEAMEGLIEETQGLASEGRDADAVEDRKSVV